MNGELVLERSVFDGLLLFVGLPTLLIALLILFALVFESKVGRRGIEWVDQRRKANARWAEIQKQE